MAKKVVVLGGGTGTYAVLSGLKKYPLDITAIVTMADSGGSARKERDEFGMLPVSDVRKALLALSPEDGDGGFLRDLFNYRFSEGIGVEGTTFGNLFLVALTNVLGSQEKAIEEAARILQIKGRVLPVALEETNLVAEYDEGVTVVGEHGIDEPQHDGRLAIRRVYLLPQVKANPKALEAIREADAIVIGPGDLYTSLLPTILVEGIAEAVRDSRASRFFILNLMSRYGQTHGFTASRHITVLEDYLQTPFTHVLVNTAKLPLKVLQYYATSEKSFPVENDLREGRYAIVTGDFLSERTFRPDSSDKLKRSLLRHDPDKLAKALVGILGKE
uniref:Putative gluconeogenesis factor n=1 Tax=candidate division WWE3 bacterium TaxID=2053526 RepID=A0A832DUT1_UNCKA